jgi:hypothetical protein
VRRPEADGYDGLARRPGFRPRLPAPWRRVEARSCSLAREGKPRLSLAPIRSKQGHDDERDWVEKENRCWWLMRRDL